MLGRFARRFAPIATRVSSVAVRRLVVGSTLLAGATTYAFANKVHANPPPAIGKDMILEEWSDTPHKTEIKVDRNGKSYDMRLVGVGLRAVPATAPELVGLDFPDVMARADLPKQLNIVLTRQWEGKRLTRELFHEISGAEGESINSMVAAAGILPKGTVISLTWIPNDGVVISLPKSSLHVTRPSVAAELAIQVFGTHKPLLVAEAATFVHIPPELLKKQH